MLSKMKDCGIDDNKAIEILKERREKYIEACLSFHNKNVNVKMEVKIATLNLCLGLKNKKLEIENLLLQNDIDILCLQEVELK